MRSMRLASIASMGFTLMALATPAWAGGGGGGGGVTAASVPGLPLEAFIIVQLGMAGYAAWRARR